MKLGRTRDVTNYDSYEPVQHLKTNPVHERLRVFTLGDPSDSNVFRESQVVLAEPLKERVIEHAIVVGEAAGPERHGLNNSARALAGLGFHDRAPMRSASTCASARSWAGGGRRDAGAGRLTRRHRRRPNPTHHSATAVASTSRA